MQPTLFLHRYVNMSELPLLGVHQKRLYFVDNVANLQASVITSTRVNEAPHSEL